MFQMKKIAKKRRIKYKVYSTQVGRPNTNKQKSKKGGKIQFQRMTSFITNRKCFFNKQLKRPRNSAILAISYRRYWKWCPCVEFYHHVKKKRKWPMKSSDSRQSSDVIELCPFFWRHDKIRDIGIIFDISHRKF